MYKLHPCRPSDWAKNFNFSVTAIYLQQKHWHSSVIIVCYTDEFMLNTSRISGTNNLNNVTQYKNFSYKLNTSIFFLHRFSTHFLLPVDTSPLIVETDQLALKMNDIWPFFHVPPSMMNEWWFMSSWNSSLQTEGRSLKHQSPTYYSVLAYLPWWF